MFYETMYDRKDEEIKLNIIDELTNEQQSRLQESLLQIKMRKTISHNEAITRLEKWRTK